MNDENPVNPALPASISKADFKKIFTHLCLASKKLQRSDRAMHSLEQKAILEKIDAVERKDHSRYDAWIKSRLSLPSAENKPKVVVVKPKDAKESEIQDIKKHVELIKRMYEELKLNKNVSRDKLLILKQRLETLEKSLKARKI